MEIKNSWLQKRKVFLMYIFVEMSLYFFLNKIYSNQNNIFYISIWLLISYLFGRYHNYSKSKKLFLLLKLYQILGTIFYTNSMFLLINISKNTFKKSYYFSINFFIDNLLFFAFSYVLLAIIQNVFLKKFNPGQKWLFIGSVNRFSKLKELANIKTNKIKLEIKKSPLIKKDLLKKKYNGIIISNEKIISEEEKKFLLDIQSADLTLIDDLTWMEYEYQRLPSELITFENLLNKSLNLKINSLSFRIKRFTDIFMSLILIALSTPLIIFFGFLIYIEDKGPIFYSQFRKGYAGNEFKILKLRSMYLNSEPEGAIWSKSEDKRITKVGKFIRSTGIDEIPQLINIFKGDMSLIGPRPERAEIDEKLILEIPFYQLRYLYKPGLSGWAQVNYPYASSIEDTKNKLSFDFYYMKNFSVWLDILILLKTIRLIFNLRKSNLNLYN